MDFTLRESANMREKLINIEIIRHKGTGMYLAMSDDMKGLYVHARTLAELGERVPTAIKDIYAAAGKPVEFFHAVYRGDQFEYSLEFDHE